MDLFSTPSGFIMSCVAVIAVALVLAFLLRVIVDAKTVLAVPEGKQPLTRAEYARDEITRKEHRRQVAVKFRRHARRTASERRRTDDRFNTLVSELTELRVQIARLATTLEADRAKENESILKES